MLLKGNNSIFWHYDEFESADYGLSRIIYLLRPLIK